MVAIASERDIRRIDRQESETTKTFFDAIGRPDLNKEITLQTPILSVSMEIDVDGAFAGGLGILEGDKLLEAEKLGLPYVAVTFFPPKRWNQKLDIFWPKQDFYQIHPEDVGFKKEAEPVIIYANGDTIVLDVYTKSHGTAKVVALHESELGGLYSDPTDSEHRLYQKVVLGFGDYKAIKNLGLKPSRVLVNESPTVLFPLAEFDDLCQQGMSVDDALEMIREKYMYINHTLEPAAEAKFPWDKLERYVFRNIESKAAKKWLSDMVYFHGSELRLSTLALALCGKYEGVSRLHAQVASQQFRDHEDKPVVFEAITNGIFMDRWTYPEFTQIDNAAGIVDRFDLPTPYYAEKIARLDAVEQNKIKDQGRREMREYLKTRKDQNDKGIKIPPDAKVVVWAKRFVNYKRPDMAFEDPERLAGILEERNIHMVISSKIVEDPYKFLHIMQIIDANPTLKERVHYVQNYDPELARHLVAGADVWLNTPVVGKEACGTSIFKAIRNRTIVISTNDGGIADIQDPPCLLIQNGTYETEVESLYAHLKKAADILDGKDSDTSWDKFVKNQLTGYLPIISGARMMRDYIYKGFPKQESLIV